MPRSRARRAAFAPALVAAACALARAAAAGPLYVASTSGPGGVSGPDPVAIDYAQMDPVGASGFASRAGSAFAGPGLLGATSTATASLPEAVPRADVPTGLQASFARFQVDDLVFGDAAGAASLVSGSLRLELRGALFAQVDDALTSDADARTFAVVRVGAQLFGASYFADVRGQAELFDAFGQAALTSASGALSEWPLAVVELPFAGLPVGVPLGLGVFLYTEASTLIGIAPDEPIALRSDASASFALALATQGPVFALPAGFSTDSPSAGIVANRFVVPEPGPLALAASGLLALGLARRLGSGLGGRAGRQERVGTSMTLETLDSSVSSLSVSPPPGQPVPAGEKSQVDSVPVLVPTGSADRSPRTHARRP